MIVHMGVPRFENVYVAKPCALLGGFEGMLPQAIIFKHGNLVRFMVF